MDTQSPTIPSSMDDGSVERLLLMVKEFFQTRGVSLLRMPDEFYTTDRNNLKSYRLTCWYKACMIHIAFECEAYFIGSVNQRKEVRLTLSRGNGWSVHAFASNEVRKKGGWTAAERLATKVLRNEAGWLRSEHSAYVLGSQQRAEAVCRWMADMKLWYDLMDEGPPQYADNVPPIK